MLKPLVGPNNLVIMDETPCIRCSITLENDAVISPSCGQPVGSEIEITHENKNIVRISELHSPQTYEIGNIDTQSQEKNNNTDIYQRPENYKFTLNVTTRIAGTIKLDVNVVEEIIKRPELQKEAIKILLVNFTIVAIFQIVMIFTFDDKIYVKSKVGTFVHIFLTNFVTGFLYIYCIAIVGKYLGESKSGITHNTVVRGLSYGFVANAIEWILAFSTSIFQSNLVAYLWISSLLYYFLVFGFILHRTLGKSYLMSFATLITTNILVLYFFQKGILELINILFGGSFKLIG